MAKVIFDRSTKQFSVVSTNAYGEGWNKFWGNAGKFVAGAAGLMALGAAGRYAQNSGLMDHLAQWRQDPRTAQRAEDLFKDNNTPNASAANPANPNDGINQQAQDKDSGHSAYWLNKQKEQDESNDSNGHSVYWTDKQIDQAREQEKALDAAKKNMDSISKRHGLNKPAEEPQQENFFDKMKKLLGNRKGYTPDYKQNTDVANYGQSTYVANYR